MLDIIKVIILGIVEGLTEFLPISSTGHLIVASALLDFNALGGTFEIFIQFGAVVAVVLFYRAELFQQVRLIRSDPGVQRVWLSIFWAFIPAAVIGFLFSDQIKAVLFNPSVVATALIVGGVIFLIVERYRKDISFTTTRMEDMTPRQAILIGLAQTLALIPGVSRSGASIVSGLLVGMDRQTATRFSFFLAIPTLGLATLYDLAKSLNQVTSSDFLNLMLGAFIAGIVAWLSIAWLLRFVERNSFVVFGYYRILAGIIILLLPVFSMALE
jgi:undecaprenyl-diphosphatase